MIPSFIPPLHFPSSHSRSSIYGNSLKQRECCSGDSKSLSVIVELEDRSQHVAYDGDVRQDSSIDHRSSSKPDLLRSDDGPVTPVVRLDNKPRNLFAPKEPMRESFRVLDERWLVAAAYPWSAWHGNVGEVVRSL